MLEIYTYNAGKGDCIRIRFGNRHNIIVDTGVIRFGARFLEICEEIIKEDEIIDALIITHTDDDHLGGALYAARLNTMPNIRQVWMNYQDWDIDINSPLSVRQNNELYSFLRSREIQVNKAFKNTSFKIDEAEICFLWPTKEVVSSIYIEEYNTPLSRCCDYGLPLTVLADDKITVSDSSISNRASIVFSFYYEGKLLLFTGDAWGDDILNSLKCNQYDLIKLPHHGSIRNISNEWNLIKCNCYLICTDGISHPDKQTIAKLHKWNGKITVYSPSKWWEDSFFLDNDNIEGIECITSDGNPIII